MSRYILHHLLTCFCLCARDIAQVCLYSISVPRVPFSSFPFLFVMMHDSISQTQRKEENVYALYIHAHTHTHMHTHILYTYIFVRIFRTYTYAYAYSTHIHGIQYICLLVRASCAYLHTNSLYIRTVMLCIQYRGNYMLPASASLYSM